MSDKCKNLPKNTKELLKIIHEFFEVYRDASYIYMSDTKRAGILIEEINLSEYDPEICINYTGTANGVCFVSIETLEDFASDPIFFKHAKMFYFSHSTWGQYEKAWEQVRNLKRP